MPANLVQVPAVASRTNPGWQLEQKVVVVQVAQFLVLSQAAVQADRAFLSVLPKPLAQSSAL